MSTVLVIDDDRSVHRLVAQALVSTPMEVWTALDVYEGLALVERRPDLVLLDIVLPDISGLEAAAQIRAIDPKLPVIFITGQGTSETAIEAMKTGAYDYLPKPLNLARLRELVERALEIRRLTSVPVGLPSEQPTSERGEYLLGNSPPMQEVYKAIGRVAPQNVAVLIQGESGTGKELIARAIYQHSRRASRPFFAVHCGSLPESALESELFGHDGGANAGAGQQRIGRFEQCAGGTIFLDEVDHLSNPLQSRVLRILKQPSFERPAGTETTARDVRILAATNRDLRKLVAGGAFREDLYYQLSGFTIDVPPLRQRGDDLLLLVQHYLTQLNRDAGHDVHGISPEALDTLMRYSWPGNVRELQAVIRHALLQTNGSIILPEFLPDIMGAAMAYRAPDKSCEPLPCDLQGWVDGCLQDRPRDIYAQVMRKAERYVLTRVLRAAEGNQSRAAKLLGITRSSLRSKIRLLGINLHAAVIVDANGADDNGYDTGPFRETGTVRSSKVSPGDGRL